MRGRRGCWQTWRWLVGTPDRVTVADDHMTVTVGIDAWGRFGAVYRRGDSVPHLDHLSTYSVASRTHGREGDGRLRPLWLNVAQGRIASWSVKPIMDAAFDERGRRIWGARCAGGGSSTVATRFGRFR